MPSPGTVRRRRVVVATILAVGWIAAVAVYLAVPGVPEDEAIAEMQGSREYERQVEVLGGKGALLAAQLDQWLAGLWQGKNLAYTIAVLTALVAFAYWAWERARAWGADTDR